MSSFVEVIQNYKRMCDSHSSNCNNCPLMSYSHNDMDICKGRMKTYPDEYESIIMGWAAKHPLPQYPSWKQWLMEEGILIPVDGYTAFYTATGTSAMSRVKEAYVCTDKVNNPIPEEVADVLKIKPLNT